MGRGGKKGGHGKGRGGKSDRAPRNGGGQSRHEDNSTFTDDKTNARFEEYYRTQNILPSEEWPSFLAACQEFLPTTFRLTGSRTTAHDLNEVIQSIYIPHLQNVEWEGKPVPAPFQIPWFPEGFAWQLNVQKTVVRKSPEFKKFQHFLVFETDSGHVSRQEAVSMIPPLLLDVKPHHNVLDMCAAPGSKTAQLLEALHATSAMPPGIVIANDSDYKRAQMLVHQSARLPSPCLMVTNVDAASFPSIKIPSDTKKSETLHFDRILCDVPCSGDGTMRKNIGIWKSWGPGDGNGLHVLQVRILTRAMQLLTKEGRIVYSTCSLNPVENEAVLAAALNIYPGKFMLLDVSDRLPGLVRRPGVKNWSVSVNNMTMKMMSTWEEYQASLLNSDGTAKLPSSKVVRTHFPPDNADELHLDRSLRIYPHFQNTGGFFIAVLVRTDSEAGKAALGISTITAQPPLKRPASALSDSEDPSQSSKKSKTEAGASPAEDVATIDSEAPAANLPDPIEKVEALTVMGENGPERIANKNEKFNEAPYTYLGEEDPLVKACMETLRILPTFPTSQLFVRSYDPTDPRGIYLSNALAKTIITNNDYNKLRLISAGVNCFRRQDRVTVDVGNGKKEKGERTYRFVDDGTEAILPYVDEKWMLSAGTKELKIMLDNYYPLLQGFAPEFRAQCEGREFGSYLIKFNPPEDAGEAMLRHPLILPFWISGSSTSLMIDKQAKSALCLRLFGEDTTPYGKEQLAKRRPRPDATPVPGTPANEEELESKATEADVDIDMDADAKETAPVDEKETSVTS